MSASAVSVGENMTMTTIAMMGPSPAMAYAMGWVTCPTNSFTAVSVRGVSVTPVRLSPPGPRKQKETLDSDGDQPYSRECSRSPVSRSHGKNSAQMAVDVSRQRSDANAGIERERSERSPERSSAATHVSPQAEKTSTFMALPDGTPIAGP